MATESVNIKVQVDAGDGVKNVGNIRRELKEANAELIAAQRNFGEYSAEAVAAAKKVAELRDSVQDARETADLFDPGKKFQAFSGALNAVAGGFSAVQGALGLIGVESEEVEKQLLKVQSALALSQGLSTITDSAKDFARLGVVIRTQVVTAFQTLRGAIIATGIGAFVVALGTIVAYWEDIKGLVSGVSKEQEKLNEETKKNLQAQQEKLDAIDGQNNQLKLQGKSEREILELKLKQSNEAIKAAEINVANAKILKNTQIEAAKRNADILQGIIRLISAPLTVILKSIDLIGEAVGKNFGLEEKFSGGLANLIFDPIETEKQANDTIKQAENTLEQLKEKRAGFQLSIQQIDKTAGQKRTQDAAEAEKARLEAIRAQQDAFDAAEKDRLTKSKQQIDDANKILDDARKERELNRLEGRERELRELQLQYLEEQRAAEGNYLALLALEEAYRIRRKEINDKFDAEVSATAVKNAQTSVERTIAQLSAETSLKKQAFADEKAINKARVDAQIEIAAQIGNAIGSLATLLGRNTAAGKVAALAEIAINTGVGFANGLRIAQQTSLAAGPGAGFVFPVFLATQFAAVLSAATRAKSILASVPGPGGGGASAPAIGNATAPLAPALPLTQTVTQLQSGTINQLQSATTRAYVVESDVTGAQERIRRLNRAARLG